MLISPFSSASMLSRPDRARKRMSALLCGEGSILSITPGQSILSAEALKKLQTAYLTGHHKVVGATAVPPTAEASANKRRKLQRDAFPQPSVSVEKDLKDERSQESQDTKDVKEVKDVKCDGKEQRAAFDDSGKDDAAGSSSKEDFGKESGGKEARDKEIDEAAYDIAHRLVEWSATFSLVDDLDECGPSMRDSDDEGESPATVSIPNGQFHGEVVLAEVVAEEVEEEERENEIVQPASFADFKADFKGDTTPVVVGKEAGETLFSPPPLQLTYSLCGDGAPVAGDVFDTAFADSDGFTSEVIALPSECANFDDPLAFAADL